MLVIHVWYMIFKYHALITQFPRVHAGLSGACSGKFPSCLRYCDSPVRFCAVFSQSQNKFLDCANTAQNLTGESQNRLLPFAIKRYTAPRNESCFRVFQRMLSLDNFTFHVSNFKLGGVNVCILNSYSRAKFCCFTALALNYSMFNPLQYRFYYEIM